MHFILKIIITGLLIVPFPVHSQEGGIKSAAGKRYTAPLRIPLFLSGNFGEIRTDHFHAGLDFKTQQSEGKEVLAADSGFVMRVSVQSGGYGHAVYLRHPDGAITVYGHLQHFEPALGAWVTEQQYRKKSFEVNLFPSARQFVYARGAVIGLSGNTGSSGGPHLHFEIRDKSGEVALNGLRYPFAVVDTIRPVITRLGLYAIDRNSAVNDSVDSFVLTVNDSAGIGVVPRVYGRIGFGVETFDFLNGSSNVCSPLFITLHIDNRLLFRCVLDSIPFALTGTMNSHIRYDTKITGGLSIQKLYLDPGNKLAIYPVAVNRGVIEFKDSLLHHVHISSEDAYGNRRDLQFRIQSVPPPHPARPEEALSDSLVKFSHQHAGTIVREGIRLELPAGALYDDNKIRFSAHSVDSLLYSPVYHIGSETIPLQMQGKLSIAADRVPRKLRSRMYVASLTYKGKHVACGGKYKDGSIYTRFKSFGRYFLLADTVPPSLQPIGFTTGDTCMAGKKISFRITDTGSGISRYAGFVDGNWALFQFDGKNNLLSYIPDATRLTSGKVHALSLHVTDDRGNTTRFKGSFFY